MAVRNVATTSTLEGFRTTFNSLGTDVGDLASLNTTDKASIVAAVNEVSSAVTTAFTIKDSSSTVQQINSGDVFSFVGDSNVSAVVSATDTMTITLNSTISGLTSVSATTLTDGTATITGGTINATTINENSVRVATQPFAIAQSIALG
jgi:hypothetical protein